MKSPEVKKTWSMLLRGEEGDIIGYGEITPAVHARMSANKIFQGTLKVFDASRIEIATIDFTRNGTGLIFPGETPAQPVLSPMDKRDSIAFFQYEERIRDLLRDFARAVVEQKSDREAMQIRLSEICRDLIDPKAGPDRALAVSVTIPMPRSRG